jgi:toxin YoeB
MLTRINRLNREASRDPGVVVGKPERLSGDPSGAWSRRIDHEYRLVCTVHEDQLVVLRASYDY